MSYHQEAAPTASYGGMVGAPEPGGYRTKNTESTGLSVSLGQHVEHLEAMLSCVNRLNNRIHGPRPKDAQPPQEHLTPDAPIARLLERAHRLDVEIDQELTALESRL